MRPTTREEFEIAIICALPHEANPVTALFDQTYEDNNEVGKLPGDVNVYSYGRIGQHHVVLCYMPGMGKGSAAGVASNLRMSYPGIQLALVVGICGAVPFPTPSTEIILGDVIISDSLVEYDFGRQYPDHFMRKRDPKTTLGRPNREIRAILSSLKTDEICQKFNEHMLHNVQTLVNRNNLWKYPGSEQDILRSDIGSGVKSSIIQRKRLQKANVYPVAHIGTMASADTVMKSGKHRDQIAAADGAIGFEMEGAGIWDILPCVIIKGVCDYADSHKNKSWQDYAAATGACAAKAFLEHWRPNFRRVIPEVDKNCLRDLLLTDPRDDKLRIEQTKGGLLQESFSWILHNPTFQEWQENEGIKLLWVKGDAGKGKTMLMIGLIDELTKAMAISDDSPLVSYFFCQGSDSRYNNATAVLRGLLYLITVQRPYLLEYLRPRYEPAGRRLFEGPDAIYSLLGVFLNLIQGSQLPNVYIVIDAVDECETDLSQLLGFITHPTVVKSKIKWIVSSRNRDDIGRHLEQHSKLTSLRLELFPNQISQAIANFISTRVSQLPALKDHIDLQDTLKSKICQKADSTFLWAALVITELGKDVFPAEMADVLEENPAGLLPLFQKMMERIGQLHPRNVHRCFRILSAATLAYRPLHLLEMGVVAGLSDTAASITEMDRMVNMCSSFLSTREDHVFFIHQSAKEYLVSSESDVIFCAGYRQAHYDIYSRSIEMMSKTLHQNVCDLGDPGPIDAESRHKASALVCIEYSCLHLLDHLCQGLEENSESELEFADEGNLHLFFAEHFLHLMEALGILREVSSGISAIRRLQQVVKVEKSPTLAKLLHDSLRWMLIYGSVIEQAPLQVYSGALIFAPENSEIKRLFWTQRLPFVQSVTGVQKEWTHCLHVLEGRGTSAIRQVCFSADGKALATSSEDGFINIWDATTGILTQDLQGHQETVTSISYLQSNESLVSASLDGTVLLWDTTKATFEEIFRNDREVVVSTAFSPISDSLIVGLRSGKVLLRNESTSSWVQLFPHEITGKEYFHVILKQLRRNLWSEDQSTESRSVDAALSQFAESWIREAGIKAVSHVVGDENPSNIRTIAKWLLEKDILASQLPEGLRIIKISPSSHIVACVWGFSKIRLLHRQQDIWKSISLDDTFCSALEFSPDGLLLAVGSNKGSIHIWDITVGCWKPELKNLIQVEETVSSISFSQDGQSLLWSVGYTIFHENLATRSSRQTSKSLERPITAMTFSPGFSHFVLADNQGRVYIWHNHVGFLYPDEGRDYEGRAYILGSPPGFWQAVISMTYVGVGALLMLHIAEEQSHWQEVYRIFPKVLLLLAIGSFVLVMTLRIKIHHLHNSRRRIKASKGTLALIGDDECRNSAFDGEHFTKGHVSPITSISISPDGRNVATSSTSNAIHLYNTLTGGWKVRLNHGEGAGSLKNFVWLPDGQSIVTLSYFGPAKLLDANTGACVKVFQHNHELGFADVVHSRDSRLMVLVPKDCTLELWDTVTLTRIAVLRGHKYPVYVASFAPNCRTLVSASRYIIHIWDIDSCTTTYSDTIEDDIDGFVWSPDSIALAVILGNGQVRVFDTTRMTWKLTFDVGVRSIRLVAFSPDCQIIALGSADGSLSFWDTKSGICQYTMGLDGELKYLSFSKDGRSVNTNQGTIDLTIGKPKFQPIPRPLADRVSLADGWLSCDNKKLIWLPPGYRSGVWEVYDSTIVMGQYTGRVVFLELEI